MKLDYKRTLLVGLAFLSISAFWQMYDNIVPLMLRDTFGLGDTISGVVMSLDNVMALFMLPLFGALSDKAGRRMPFILWGTAAAAAAMILLAWVDLDGRSPLLFIAVLGALLFAMGAYRSPAVALMPDVTPKPLRSKANAMINLAGALGGIIALLLIKVLVHTLPGVKTNYFPLFAAVAALMAVSIAVLKLTVNEKKLRAAAREAYPESEDAPGAPGAAIKLEPAVKRSLILILLSVAFWFMGYNAVTTAFSKYASAVWGYGIEHASTCLLVATGGAILSYYPIALLSSRFGRKRVILAGVALLALCFTGAALFAASFSLWLYPLFALVGVAWAAINVNSYPMVVEISRSGDIGKYTGYYYTFSMAAQIVTPILSGALLEHVGYHTLFPYAAVMVALSFLTMSLTRHGDNRPDMPASKLEAFSGEDG